MHGAFHTRLGPAFCDPTSWASLSTLAFGAMSQGVPSEWSRWCWLAAVVSGAIGVMLRGGTPPAANGGPQ
ncbi:hypothetical protein [Telmatospirillum sp.]|uniref:hypothetical protein n=1 Tax=Telmatospirillum sp. TaxID=2079197 RepID=UPI0028491FBF|nr:hypothetical protein [Telmatospirillum sp.]MDR3438934.1 hypothetical protein [Telmatospirillum sp.]